MHLLSSEICQRCGLIQGKDTVPSQRFVSTFSQTKLTLCTCQDVRSDSTFRIPIIDFSAFRATSALSEKRRVADDIVNGFKEVGFVYLSGHGIPADVIDNVYKKARLQQQIYSQAYD